MRQTPEESPTNVIRAGTSSAGTGSSDTVRRIRQPAARHRRRAQPLTFPPAKPAAAPSHDRGVSGVRPIRPCPDRPRRSPNQSRPSGPRCRWWGFRPALRRAVAVDEPDDHPALCLTTGSTGRTSSTGVVTPSPTPVGRAPVVATSSLKTGLRPAPPGERRRWSARRRDRQRVPRPSAPHECRTPCARPGPPWPARPPAVPVARDCT